MTSPLTIERILQILVTTDGRGTTAKAQALSTLLGLFGVERTPEFEATLQKAIKGVI